MMTVKSKNDLTFDALWAQTRSSVFVTHIYTCSTEKDEVSEMTGPYRQFFLHTQMSYKKKKNLFRY